MPQTRCPQPKDDHDLCPLHPRRPPTCVYCDKPVDSGAWDGESQGWFSYGSTCMLDNRSGRYAVQQTNPEGATIIRRFATMKRAQYVAQDYTRNNAPCVWAKDWKWEAVDLGEGFTHSCAD